jgi:Flp pilus assembly protein TadG
LEIELVAAMETRLIAQDLRTVTRKFRSEQGGNVAVTFVLALIPMIGFMGAAIDYSRATSMRAALQSALDSAALMLSKEAPSLTSTQMTQRANDYFNALFTRPEALSKQLTLTYDLVAKTLTMSASAKIDTTFSRVIGKQQFDVASSTTVAWGTSRLRIALALDNTGSMSNAGKITALKTATKSLLTMLQNATVNTGDIYVSIIPFSKDVNVGASNHAASWIDWTSWNRNNGTCSRSFTDTGSSQQTDCQNAGGTWTPANHNTRNGCVRDRGTNTAPGINPGYDQKVDPPDAGNTATLFPAEQYAYCPLEMMGLSNSWTTMNTLVDNMFPNGSTNQPIGLVWGWQSLVGGGPLTVPSMDPNYQYKQIIILMSDGLNTQDRWYGNGSSTSSSVDGRMYNSSGAGGTCKNVKDAGIIVYTVHVNTGGDPMSTLLQNCASPDAVEPVGPKFFHLTSANQMVTTFNQIGTSLTKLRIAK